MNHSIFCNECMFCDKNEEMVKEPKMYLSGDFDVNGEKVYMKGVLYNNPATIVFWSDGTKTVSKCAPQDVYSKEAGLAICIAKKFVGGVKLKAVFTDWVDENSNSVFLKDVRRKTK